jgi:hypothetical protein
MTNPSVLVTAQNPGPLTSGARKRGVSPQPREPLVGNPGDEGVGVREIDVVE